MTLRNLKTAFLCTALLIASAACTGGGTTAKTPKPPGPEKPKPGTKAPMSLPEVADGSAVSTDRKTMNDLMARAARENKSVVFEVAAAWCGPCMQFAYDLDTHPEYYQKLADAGYILVKSETEKMGALSMNDFVPSFIKFFPSFYMYTPGKGWRMLGSANSYAALVDVLNRAKTVGPLAVSEFKTTIESMAKGQQTPEGKQASDRIYDSIYTMPANYSYDEMKTVVALLRAESKRFPALRLENLADEVLYISLNDYLAMNVLTVDELAADFPTFAADLTDMSRQGFSINQLVSYKVEAIARTSGPKAAAAQCESVAAAARARLTGGSLSESDKTSKLNAMATANTALCAAWELRANGVTPALREKAARLDLASLSDWNLVAQLGETDKAVATYKARYKMHADHYATAIKGAEENLQKAIDMGETAKAEELKKRIEVLKYQAANHAQVDADVEDALKTGRVLEILKVLN